MQWGLALSGGGVRAAAHIGVLRALDENNIKCTSISGTSAGAIVAALVSCGYDQAMLEQVAYSLVEYGGKLIRLNWRGIIKLVYELLLRKPITFGGILSHKPLSGWLNAATNDTPLDGAKMGFAAVATDINMAQRIIYSSLPPNNEKLLTRHDVWLRDETMANAVLASCMLPVIFDPVIRHERRLVDGGLVDNLPVKELKMLGEKKILGVYLGYEGMPKPDVDNIIEIAGQSIDIMSAQLVACRSHGATYILLPELPATAKVLSFDAIPELIDAGYACAQKNMEDIKKALAI